MKQLCDKSSPLGAGVKSEFLARTPLVNLDDLNNKLLRLDSACENMVSIRDCRRFVKLSETKSSKTTDDTFARARTFTQGN